MTYDELKLIKQAVDKEFITNILREVLNKLIKEHGEYMEERKSALRIILRPGDTTEEKIIELRKLLVS